MEKERPPFLPHPCTLMLCRTVRICDKAFINRFLLHWLYHFLNECNFFIG